MIFFFDLIVDCLEFKEINRVFYRCLEISEVKFKFRILFSRKNFIELVYF